MNAVLQPKPNYIVCDGNEAAAWAVSLAQVDMVAVYPITPQSSLVEYLAKVIADGRLGAEIVVEAQIVAQLSVKCDSAGGRCSNRRRGRASVIGDSAGHGSGDSPKYSPVRDAEESA